MTQLVLIINKKNQKLFILICVYFRVNKLQYIESIIFNHRHIFVFYWKLSYGILRICSETKDICMFIYLFTHHMFFKAFPTVLLNLFLDFFLINYKTDAISWLDITADWVYLWVNILILPDDCSLSQDRISVSILFVHTAY